LPALIQYVDGQEEHHHKDSFQDEVFLGRCPRLV
jgi:hypothetical protein